MNDRSLMPDGVKPRDDGPDLGTENLEALFRAAKEITDDLGDQVTLVTLCVSAGWDANQLRRKGLMGAGLIPNRKPTIPELHTVRHHESKKPFRRRGPVS